jgi:EmrB/QacA subfamily drug resistance transporter
MVLIVGMFMAVLGTSIINVAIPHIQKDLGAGADQVRWVSTGYLLTLGVAVPLSGWLGERFGHTRVYLAALCAFSFASALCGLSWDLTSLIVFRVLQAIPGGIIPVITMTLLYRIVPPAKIGTAMGLYGLGVILAPALGPAVGGYLVEYASWHLIFWVMVPFGIIGLIAAIKIFPQVTPSSPPKFDLLGFLTIAYGLVALMLAADRGTDWGWTSYGVLILTVSGVLSLALFVVIELEVESPLINLGVFRNFAYPNSLLLMAVNSLGLFALLYYVPLFLQTNQGYQASDTGLLLMPSALTMAVMAPIAGRLYDRFGGRWPAAIGLAISAYGSFLLAGITPDVPEGQLIAWTTIRNVGVGLSMMPVMTSGMRVLPTNLLGDGSAMNNVVLRVSSSLGVAAFGGLQTAQLAQGMNDRAAFLTSDPAMSSQWAKAAAKGPEGLGPMYAELVKTVSTTTYANAFHLIGLITVVGAILALLLPTGRAVAAEPATDKARPAERASEPRPTSAAVPARSAAPVVKREPPEPRRTARDTVNAAR